MVGAGGRRPWSSRVRRAGDLRAAAPRPSGSSGWCRRPHRAPRRRRPPIPSTRSTAATPKAMRRPRRLPLAAASARVGTAHRGRGGRPRARRRRTVRRGAPASSPTVRRIVRSTRSPATRVRHRAEQRVVELGGLGPAGGQRRAQELAATRSPANRSVSYSPSAGRCRRAYRASTYSSHGMTLLRDLERHAEEEAVGRHLRAVREQRRTPDVEVVAHVDAGGGAVVVGRLVRLRRRCARSTSRTGSPRPAPTNQSCIDWMRSG